MVIVRDNDDVRNKYNMSTRSVSSKTKRDGNACLGLSLARKSAIGHEESVNHQTVFDLNEVCDRDYEYIESLDDDGFLVGGGEPGYPLSFKIPAKDTAHVELMRIGTFRPDWGGITEEDIIRVLYSGKVLIPQMQIMPTSVKVDDDINLMFDMIPSVPDLDKPDVSLPVNWCIRFVQNQLLEHFDFPAKRCPDSFHASIAKRVKFRSPTHKTYYLGKCYNSLKKWRQEGPKPLNSGGWDIDGSIIDGFINDRQPNEYNSGIWLFENRHLITHFFPPNFLPPYNEPSKRKLIINCLKKEWDNVTGQFQPLGHKYIEEMRRLKNRNQTNIDTLTTLDYGSCPPICAPCVPS